MAEWLHRPSSLEVAEWLYRPLPPTMKISAYAVIVLHVGHEFDFGRDLNHSCCFAQVNDVGTFSTSPSYPGTQQTGFIIIFCRLAPKFSHNLFWTVVRDGMSRLVAALVS